MKKTNNLIDKFLEELRKIPIIQVACEKTGISRNSIYRWKRKDEKFSQKMEQALIDGEAFVNDMSESQLLSMIKEGEWPAISFWLRHRNPKFKDKMEITAKIVDEKLTPEQEEVVRKALELGSIIKIDNQEKNNDIQQQ
jgi:predicted DNA binding protein